MNAYQQRRGGWLQTHSGVKFFPLDPRPDEIRLLDIAHGLSRVCRYAGHTTMFYSVAEHSVLLARYLPKHLRKWALLHDAPEAYIGDMVRPLKMFMPEYCAVEEMIMSCVKTKFGLAGDMPDLLIEADRRILTDEKNQAMAINLPWKTDAEPLGVGLAFWSPQQARIAFLNEWALAQENRGL